eukprot:TRINITY_DN40776_c0_g1_i1.p1 TRINITY_DN40776_c0_g1~~TRINITY_DN40776_c0_g1_i1.p1  ORF type:complete len:284 (+),score=91.03 TRINITY_DN40776_c0_g1_i1:59-853(+)
MAEAGLPPMEEPEPAPELRGITCSLGELNRAHGSVRYAHGGTSVLMSVSGPLPARERSMRTDRGVVKVVIRGHHRSLKRKIGATGLATQYQQQKELLEVSQMTTFVQGCLEEVLQLSDMPRMQVLFTAQVLTNDGSLCSVLINAAILAVLDAGLPCRGVVAALEGCTATGADGARNLRLDPTRAMLDACDSAGLFVHWPGRGLVSSKTAGAAMSSDLFWMYHAATQRSAAALVSRFRYFLRKGKHLSGLPAGTEAGEAEAEAAE